MIPFSAPKDPATVAAKPSTSDSPPLDQDDLEVALINQAFEAEQQQCELYGSHKLKNAFYSSVNSDTASKKRLEK